MYKIQKPEDEARKKEAEDWLNRGDSYYRISDYEKALECYDKALEIDSECSDAIKSKLLILLDKDIIGGVQEIFSKYKIFKVKVPAPLPEIIQDIQSVLKRKGQVILYGPPGTGKTYWAMRAALEMASLNRYGLSFDLLSEEERSSLLQGGEYSGSVRICCFHPAYGYEDFLEGYRPEESNGKMSFIQRDGIFKKLCKDALDAPATNFYLIIDEINRGDIPRIFGELMTVLEKNKRGKQIILPVSGDQMLVPKNVYVIGTMNTADRSIALLDTALRRRFGFIEIMPDASVLGDSVISGIHLGNWLDALNCRICENVGRDARNRQVGHSYLMENGNPISSLESFSRVVRDEVIPLLEEYCYEDYSTLGKILGDEIVDIKDLMIRQEIFEDSIEDEFVRVMLEISKERSALSQAVIQGSDIPEEKKSDFSDDSKRIE